MLQDVTSSATCAVCEAYLVHPTLCELTGDMRRHEAAHPGHYFVTIQKHIGSKGTVDYHWNR